MAKIAGIREAPKQVAVEKDIPPFCFPTEISPTFSSGLLRVLNQKQTIGSATTKTGTTHRNEQETRAQKIEHHATIQLEPSAEWSYIRTSSFLNDSGAGDGNRTHVGKLRNLRREPPTQVSNSAVREARPKRKQGSNPWWMRQSFAGK